MKALNFQIKSKKIQHSVDIEQGSTRGSHPVPKRITQSNRKAVLKIA